MRARKEGQFVLKMNFASNILSLEKPHIYMFMPKKSKSYIALNDILKALNIVSPMSIRYFKTEDIISYTCHCRIQQKHISLRPKDSFA